MKIGMILDKAFPPDPRVENEALYLIKHGHEIHLYCLDYAAQQAEYELIKGIHVHRQRFPKHVYRFSALAYTVPYYHLYLKKSIIQFVQNNDIEVLHIHDMQVARAVFMANKTLNIPLVLDLHENRPEIMKFYAHVQSALGKMLIFPSIWKKFEYKYIQQADKVIVITKEAKEYYLEEMTVSEDKFCIVPNTVRKAFYTNYELKTTITEQYKDNFTVLYLGDTGLRRGMITLIKSLKYLIEPIPNIKIVVVGNSKTDHILQSLVTELGYEKYVDLKGWQNFELFPSYIIASDIGVCPIHKNIHHETTYANKIFQSLAFGKPIVVSDCKSQVNVVETYECGLVFKDRNVQDFAEKILALYQDKQLYQRLSTNGKKAIEEKLNWGEIATALQKLYQNI